LGSIIHLFVMSFPLVLELDTPPAAAAGLFAAVADVASNVAAPTAAPLVSISLRLM
jgi:hypothetical protein